MTSGTPIIIMNQNTRREQGRSVQLGNINAAKTVADVIRTCLGPKAMLKMLMDPMGGIVMTNDGNAILREIQVQHPAAKSLIEIARTQDEECGDGTTSVVILAGEMCAVARQFIDQNMHPTQIIRGYRKALDDGIDILRANAIKVDCTSDVELLRVIKSTVGTKFVSKWSELICRMALTAVRTVHLQQEGGTAEIDIKRYAKVEKVPGGSIEDSAVLSGVMFNKDVLHASMRRRIPSPRILLLDCGLEYTKGESQTNMELTGDQDFAAALAHEEAFIKRMCDEIIVSKPDLVISEKGISDLAIHYLSKANITAIRRLRKTDNNRVARAVGAQIVHRTDEIREMDIGTRGGLFEVQKIGDEYFTFITGCQDPKACSILLRGASKDILNEVERNLNDAMQVGRNILADPLVVPGGGASEMTVSTELLKRANTVQGVEQWPYKAVAQALEVIPRTLIQNCGGNAINLLTAVRAAHNNGNHDMGIDGEKGELVSMTQLDIFEPLIVKLQTMKTAIETAILLLRIDDIISGTKKAEELNKKSSQQSQAVAPTDESMQE